MPMPVGAEHVATGKTKAVLHDGSSGYCKCDSSACTLISRWAERPETKAQMAYDCAFTYVLAVQSALWVKPLDVWPRPQEKRPA